MAVSTENALSGPYLANGLTTVFPFTFAAASSAEVGVIARDESESEVDAGAFVVAVLPDGSGSVTFAAPPSDGLTITIYSNPVFTQDIDFEDGSPWLASPVNRGYDRSAIRDQALRRDTARAIRIPMGEEAVDLPTAVNRAGSYLAFDGDGTPIPASGTGNDSALRTDLAAPTGSALVSFKRSAAATGSTVDAVLKRFVFAEDYGYCGPSGDSSIAINAALQDIKTTGGDVALPPRVCRIDSTIEIGDGSAGIHSTWGGVRLLFQGLTGIGANNPLGGSSLKSYVAGPAIRVNGRIEGWGVERGFIAFGTSDTSAVGVEVIEGTRGCCPDMTIVNPPGGGVLMTTRNQNNCETNVFPRLNIWLGPTYTNYGIKLTAGSDGSVGNSSHNSFPDLLIIPGKTGQKGVWFQLCGTNYFPNYICKSFDETIHAVYLDYSVNADWPRSNMLQNADWHGSSITQSGSPSATAKPFANRITGLTQDNSARIPRISGLAVDRIKLAADTEFYVSNAGTDAGATGLYSAGPWLNAQHAYDWIVSQYDLNGYNATIRLATGSYDGVTAITPPVGKDRVIIAGDSVTPGLTIINMLTTPFIARAGCALELRTMNLQPAGGNGCLADGGTIIIGASVIFGTCVGDHMVADNGGQVRVEGNYFIDGDAPTHFAARHGGTIYATGKTATLLANAAITYFAFADGPSCLNLPAMTFTLGAFAITGQRYLAQAGALIDTNGGGASYFPGSIAGASATGTYR